MARAKPPLKHMPTTPTPPPPCVAERCSASRRSGATTRLVRPLRSTSNSRETQIAPTARARSPGVTDGKVPASCGIQTLNPSRARRRQKSR